MMRAVSGSEIFPRTALDTFVEWFSEQQFHHDVRTAIARDTVIKDLNGVFAVDRRSGTSLVHEPRLRVLNQGVLGNDELDVDTCSEG